MKTPYEDILDTMRDQGSIYNEQGCRIGNVKNNSGTILINGGEAEIDTEDYYIEESIKGTLSKGDKVLIKRLTSQRYVVICKVVRADA